MVYRPRIVDSILDRKLSVFGAVVITGPKGCGKTTTAKQKAKSVIEFQDEDRRERYLSVASEMPSKLLEGTMPVAMQTSSLLSPGFVLFPRFLLGRGILPPLSGPLNDSLRYISSICISDPASALKGGSVSKSISKMRLSPLEQNIVVGRAWRDVWKYLPPKDRRLFNDSLTSM